jgi:hypothetical protein
MYTWIIDYPSKKHESALKAQDYTPRYSVRDRSDGARLNLGF